MKRMNFFVLLLVTMALSCNFTACGGDEAVKTEQTDPDGDEDDSEDGKDTPDGGKDNPDGGKDNPDGGKDNPDDGKDNPDDGEETEVMLVGTWIPIHIEGYSRYWNYEGDNDHYRTFAEDIVDGNADEVETHVVTIHADHSFVYDDSIPGGGSIRFESGVWTFRDNLLTLEALYYHEDVGAGGQDYRDVETKTYKILSLSETMSKWEYHFLLEQDEEVYYVMTCQKTTH